MNNIEEAAQIFLRVFEALARQNGKTLSAKTREDVEQACSLLGNAAADLEVLEDLTDAPRRSLGEYAVADERFQRWREERE